MFFDFCVGDAGASGPPCGLDTIYWIWGDRTYQTPRKAITPGKTYLVFTTAGQGQIRFDGLTYDVRAGECLAMRPTRDFSYGCPGSEWHFWWFELAHPQPYLETAVLLHNLSGDFLFDLFGQSLACAKQRRWDIAQSLFTSALMLLAHDQERRKASPGMSRLSDAERHIRENLGDISVAALCDHYGLQERTLRNLCHQLYHVSPVQLIRRIRLETARQLLVNTTMSLGQIAAAIGYSSQFHFSRCFQAQFHLSPSEYRRQFTL